MASGAPSHDAGTLHVDMCIGKAVSCAAVDTLSFCSRKVQGEYFAQFTGGRVAVEEVGGKESHFRSPVEPKRSVLILSGSLPEALRIAVTFSRNDLGRPTQQ